MRMWYGITSFCKIAPWLTWNCVLFKCFHFSKFSSCGRLRKFCSTFLGLYPLFKLLPFFFFIYLTNLSEAMSKVCGIAAGESWREILIQLYSSTVVHCVVCFRSWLKKKIIWLSVEPSVSDRISQNLNQWVCSHHESQWKCLYKNRYCRYGAVWEVIVS